MHERRRAAAVEVDRVAAPSSTITSASSLIDRPVVDARAAPVARDGEDDIARDPERGAWMPPFRDVGVELPRAGREPLAIIVWDRRRRRRRGRAAARRGRGPLSPPPAPRRGRARRMSSPLDDDAGAAGSVRLGDRLVGHGAAVDPEIAQRPIRVAKEEAPDDRLVDLVPRAPDVEPLGQGKCTTRTRVDTPRVPDRVERRHAPVGERPSPEQVLDPVRHRRGFSSPWGQHSVRPHLARPSAGAIAASQTDRRRFLPPNQTIGVHCGRRGGKSRGGAALGRGTRASARAGARGHGARSCLRGGR